MKFNRGLEENSPSLSGSSAAPGKSYYRFEDGAVTMETFLQDLLSLTAILLERFRQNCLYLVGHSWGSVLGTYLHRAAS